MEVRAILVDLDDTLLDDRAAIDQAVRGTVAWLRSQFPLVNAVCLKSTSKRISGDAAFEARRPGTALDRPDLERMEALQQAWHYALSRLGIQDEALSQRATEFYAAQRKQTHRLFADADDFLQGIARRFKLAIVTNGPSAVQRDKIRLTALDRYASSIVISEEVGVRKPAPAIFRMAAQTLGARPGEAVHVGDSLYADVRGARAAGVGAVWVNRTGRIRGPGDPIPDLEVDSLRHLPELLVSISRKSVLREAE
jgi:putative hydrolase of the HAD superfamily